MTRLPELKYHMDDDAIPDASEALELEDFARTIPKLIGILPDLLRERTDPRHNVALAEMVAGLTACLDQLRPLALVRSRLLVCHFAGSDFEIGCVADSNRVGERDDEIKPYTSYS